MSDAGWEGAGAGITAADVLVLAPGAGQNVVQATDVATPPLTLQAMTGATAASLLLLSPSGSEVARFNASGSLTFGGDTTISRQTSGQLAVNGEVRSMSTLYSFSAMLASDVQPRIALTPNQGLWFGSGSAIVDVQVGRVSSALLATNASFEAFTAGAGSATVNKGGYFLGTSPSGASPWVFFGNRLADANYGITMTDRGRFDWGDGANASDAVLSRFVAGQLLLGATGKETSLLVLPKSGLNAIKSYAAAGQAAYATRQVAADPILSNRLLDTDAQRSFSILGDGTISWGSGGTAVQDTTLARTSAGVLSLGTGKLQGGTPTAAADYTRKDYVDALLAANDAMVYKGALDCSASPNYPAADAGATYKVSVAGKIGGSAGPNVEVGDTLICTVDSSVAGTHAAVGANWTIIQANIDGAVIGPASATSGHVVTFNGTTGKLIQDGGYVAENAASKGAASGYMGLDASSRGAQSPKLHHADHSKGGADAVALSDIATAIGDVPSALIDAMLPWRVEITPWTVDTSEVGAWTRVGGAVLGGGYRQSAGAQNNEITFDVVLAAGTWELTVIYAKGGNIGICTPTLDGTDLATFDGYNGAGATVNNVYTQGGATIAATGKKTLKLKATSKNASASNYFLQIQWITLRRTA
jgi:hypothetical protein